MVATGIQQIFVACAPSCVVYHTRDEAAFILGVHPSTLYALEKRGLKVSREVGPPRYRHDWLDEFMAGYKPGRCCGFCLQHAAGGK